MGHYHNYYIRQGPEDYYIHYLTDTERASSGAPVFTDDWEVVAIHHASRRIPPECYHGKTIKYLNEGILILSIINDFPGEIRRMLTDQ